MVCHNTYISYYLLSFIGEVGGVLGLLLGASALTLFYRTRANNGRSQLVAAPLSSQAKMHFLLAFYVTI